jgi:hypothetical protein
VTDKNALIAPMLAIVETCFNTFVAEANTFNSNPQTDARSIGFYATRVGQYAWLLWGYENVMKSLGLADATSLQRVASIRTYVEHASSEAQAAYSRALQPAAAFQQIPVGKPVQDWSPTVALQESIAKQQQAFRYMNRVRELMLNGGVPMIQAQIIARGETGYSG